MPWNRGWDAWVVTVALGAAVWAGCGGSATPGGPADPGRLDPGVPEVPAPDRWSLDIVFLDLGMEGATDPGQGADVPGEVPDGADVPTGPGPCETGEDCDSGFCVETASGEKVCAPLCLGDECPAGWECKAVINTGGDVVFICLPMVNRLCRPCEYHEDCRQPGLKTDDFCVDHGPDGKFCGRDCTTETCPDGYVCTKVVLPEDRSSAFVQCVPAEGDCTCTKDFIENGFKTTCYIRNDFGTCFGKRMCAEAGLTPCDAKTPQAEECNGADEDCDGQTDDGIAAGECEKTFGEIVCKGPEVCEGGQWVCKAQEPGPESCDAVDNDCDGTTDPEGADGCANYYRDDDGDAYGVTADFRCLCRAAPPHTAMVGGDCDDAQAAVNPGVQEACNGRDDDCDGLTDEEGANGCTDRFKDADGDGYGLAGDKKCLCSPVFPYTASQVGDCDDGEASVHPGVAETCNGRDDDCDGVKDPADSLGCADHYYDHDADGVGVADNKKCLCAPEGKYTAPKAGDCDDLDAAVHPGAVEKCNGRDDDCEGGTDEDFPQKGQPCDGPDGDQCKEGTFVCNGTGTGLDCTDLTDALAEVCNNADDDCDGATDEDLYQACSSPCGAGTETCVAGQWKNCSAMQPMWCTNYQTCGLESMCVTSCPAAPPESCNNKDDDCDGATDDNVTRPCSTMCGSGTETCHAGQWGTCTAQQPKNCLNYNNCQVEPMCVTSCPAAPSESCNNKDDNCNGQTDENLMRSCSTMCGSGMETCSFGQWVNCTAPQPKWCYDYGTCSYKDLCVSSCPTAPAESCNDKDDDCDGQTDEDYWDDDYCSNCGDFDNSWFGPELYYCASGSCSGTLQGRILPKGDVDYFSVYKVEGNDLPVSLKGKVFLTAPSGESYVFCACWSRDTQCDQSGTKCLVSTGVQVSVEVENGDSWGFDDDAWLDIWVFGLNSSSDYGCSYYSAAWSVWE